MRMSDLLRFAALYLWRQKGRAILTVLGVIIGTACIILMFAVGLSGYEQFQQSVLANVDLTQIQVMAGGMGSKGSGGIPDSAIASIKGIQHVKAASPILYIPAVVEAGKYKANLQLSGIDPAVLDASFQQGKLFSNNLPPSIVLGANVLQQFIDPDNPPDYSDMQSIQAYKPDIDLLHTTMTLQLGYDMGDLGEKGGTENPMPPSKKYRATVSGILKNAQDQDSYSTFISLDAARQLIRENRQLAKQLSLSTTSYQTAIVMADSIDHVEEVLDEVKKLGYQTYSPLDSIKQVQDEQARQQGQLLAIGFISLIISAIGIANTMYAGILERRRDIGIMKVLGMRLGKIRVLFLAEAAIIGLVGGLIGIAVSFVAAFIISSGGNEGTFLGVYFTSGMSVQIPAWLALMALGIATGVGILSGVYPAYKATKTSPLEAMRGSN